MHTTFFYIKKPVKVKFNKSGKIELNIKILKKLVETDLIELNFIIIDLRVQLKIYKSIKFKKKFCSKLNKLFA